MRQHAASLALVTLGLAACASDPASPAAQADGPPSFSRDRGGSGTGAVYTMTNATTGDAIVAFHRAADGALTPLGAFPTGGTGRGGTIDPLQSAYSVLLSDDHRSPTARRRRSTWRRWSTRASPPARATPFGFDFTTGGTFVVTEAFGGTPGQAAASSYSLAGGLRLLSGTVRDTQAEVCWTVVRQDNQYAFVTNFGSGTISSYRVAADGRITLLQAVAGQTSSSFGPRDEDLSAGGQYLYVLEIGATDHATQAVNAFKVGADGGLTKIGAYPLPQFSPAVAGLAAE